MESADTALSIQDEKVSLSSQNYHSVHTELAKLVVEIESRGTLSEPNGSLGQEREQEAHSSTGGIFGENPKQKPARQYEGAKEIGRKDDDSSHTGDSVSSDCKEEGGEDGIRSNLPIHEQPYGLTVEGRIQRGSSSQNPMTEMEGAAGCSNISLPRRGKMKGMRELGEPNTLPRRSVRLSARTSQVRRNLQLNDGPVVTSVSDGDINNCNTRIRSSGPSQKPADLWILGKQIGLACRREEEEVVQELFRMEERDMEFMKNAEVGNLNVLHADL